MTDNPLIKFITTILRAQLPKEVEASLVELYSSTNAKTLYFKRSSEDIQPTYNSEDQGVFFTISKDGGQLTAQNFLSKIKFSNAENLDSVNRLLSRNNDFMAQVQRFGAKNMFSSQVEQIGPKIRTSPTLFLLNKKFREDSLDIKRYPNLIKMLRDNDLVDNSLCIEIKNRITQYLKESTKNAALFNFDQIDFLDNLKVLIVTYNILKDLVSDDGLKDDITNKEIKRLEIITNIRENFQVLYSKLNHDQNFQSNLNNFKAKILEQGLTIKDQRNLFFKTFDVSFKNLVIDEINACTMLEDMNEINDALNFINPVLIIYKKNFFYEESAKKLVGHLKQMRPTSNINSGQSIDFFKSINTIVSYTETLHTIDNLFKRNNIEGMSELVNDLNQSIHMDIVDYFNNIIALNRQIDKSLKYQKCLKVKFFSSDNDDNSTVDIANVFYEFAVEARKLILSPRLNIKDDIGETIQLIDNCFANHKSYVDIKRLLMELSGMDLQMEGDQRFHILNTIEYQKFVVTFNNHLKSKDELEFDNTDELINFSHELDILVAVLKDKTAKLSKSRNYQESALRDILSVDFFKNTNKWIEKYNNKRNALTENSFQHIAEERIKDYIIRIIDEDPMWNNDKSVAIEIKYFIKDMSIVNESNLAKAITNKADEKIASIKQLNGSISDRTIDFIMAHLNTKVEALNQKLKLRVEEISSNWEINFTGILFNLEALSKKSGIANEVDHINTINNELQNIKILNRKEIIQNISINMIELSHDYEFFLQDKKQTISLRVRKEINKFWLEVMKIISNKDDLLIITDFNDEMHKIRKFEQIDGQIQQTLERKSDIDALEEKLLHYYPDYYDENEFYKNLLKSFLTQFEDLRLKIIEYKDKLKNNYQQDVDQMATQFNKVIDNFKELRELHKTSNYNDKFLFNLVNVKREFAKFEEENQENLRDIENFKTDFDDFFEQKQAIENFYTNVEDWVYYIEYHEINIKLMSIPFLELNKHIDDLKRFSNSNRLSKDRDEKHHVKNLPIKLNNNMPVFYDVNVISSEVANVIHKSNKYLARTLEHLECLKLNVYDGYHLDKLKHILNLKEDINKLTLGNILSIKLQSHISEIELLNTAAVTDHNIKKCLDDVFYFLSTREFTFKKNAKFIINRNYLLITDFDEVLEQLSDKLIILESIKSSKVNIRFKDLMQKINLKIGGLEETIMNLKILQNKWLYLYPIINNKTLKDEHKSDYIKFNTCSNGFLKIMEQITEKKYVSALSEHKNLSQILSTSISTIDVVHKNINKFLEAKRNKFYRLYFLGDEDLMEMLADSEQSIINIKYFKKIFPGIADIIISTDGSKAITHIKSEHDDVLPLKKPVNIVSSSEEWLQELEDQIQITLKMLTEWVLNSTSLNWGTVPNNNEQIYSLCNWIYFYEHLETKPKWTDLEETLISNLKMIGNLKTHNSDNEKLQKYINSSLILDLIMQKDIVQKLAVLDSKNNFYYNSLLKYEYQDSSQNYIYLKDEKVFIKIGLFVTHYSFEYLGNIQKLVHTPLTDKCFLVLTQAMHLGLSGNPYGPAGTGKTETVKALGFSLGRLVLVFNCDETIEYNNMCRIFKGLVGAGAWGCFDEFNRLALTQLSAISQVIQKIQSALKIIKTSDHLTLDVEILDQQIRLNKTSGIFITLNPASKDYKGRNELPDSLKSLFRPVAMTVPDTKKIIEVILVSKGYDHLFVQKSKETIYEFFNTASKLFNNNKLYDWGLRTIKTILLKAGDFYKSWSSEKYNNAILSLDHAIRINIVSKLNDSDRPTFETLHSNMIKTLCQVCKIETLNHEENKDELIFKNAIRQSFDELSFIYDSNQLETVLKLNEVLDQRVGVALVAKSGSGKTTVLDLLIQTYATFKMKFNTKKINPKIYTKKALYGYFDSEGVEFFDGLFVKLVREGLETIAENRCDRFAIIFDGDVDPEWIEALNSALDDNKLFTLPNGERFVLPSNLNIIFECQDLKFASPASISRLSIINVPRFKADLGELKSNMKQHSEEISLFENDREKLQLIEKCNISQICQFYAHKQSISYLLIAETEPDNTLFETDEVLEFYCNAHTQASEFINFIYSISKITNDNIMPKANSATILIKEITRIKKDQYGTRSLEQLLINIHDERGFYWQNRFYKLSQYKLVIFINQTQIPIIAERLRNRYQLTIHLKIQEIDNQLKNQYAIGKKSIFYLFKRHIKNSKKNAKDIEKLMSLCLYKEDLEIIKFTCAVSKITDEIVQNMINNYEKINGSLNLEDKRLFINLEFFRRRFFKLNTALSIKDAVHWVFIGVPGTLRKLSIEITCFNLGYIVHRISNLTHNYDSNMFIKELRLLWEKLYEGNRTILYIEEYQLSNAQLTSNIDMLLSLPDFTGYSAEINQFLTTKGVTDIPLKRGEMFKLMKVILVWSQNSHFEFESLLANFSSFDHMFESICDDAWTPEIRNSYVDMALMNLPEIVKKPLIQELSGSETLARQFMDLYSKLYNNKTIEIEIETKKYDAGLTILKSTDDSIMSMAKELSVEKNTLLQKQASLDSKLSEIAGAALEVAEQKKIAENLEKEILSEQAQLKLKQGVIEEELSKVTPLVEKARNEISKLPKSNVDELRTYKIPPEPVLDIFTAIMKLLNEYDTSWSNMKKFLGKRTVLDQIIGIDPRSVKFETLNEVEQFIMKKPFSFDYDQVKRVSVAAAPIAEFIKAIIKLVKAVMSIKPLESEFDAVNQKVTLAAKNKVKVQDQLDYLINQQQELKESFKVNSLEVEQLKQEIYKKEGLITKSRQLIDKLKTEHDRWDIRLKELQESKSFIVIETFLIAYYTAFLTSLNSKFAHHQLISFAKTYFKNLKTVPTTSYISSKFIKLIFNEVYSPQAVSNLIQSGPRKVGNILNNIAIQFYDIVKFIYCPDKKEMENLLSLYGSSDDVEIIDIHTNKFYYKLELAMRFGKTCFLKGVQKNINYDVLNLIENGNVVPGKTFRFGDRETDIDKKFKLFFTIEDKTNNKNLKVVDFSSSIDSIKDEILSVLVTWQKPDLEKQQLALATKKQEFALMIENSEDVLLEKLRNASTNILEDTKLWNSLETIKTQVTEVTESLKQIEVVNIEIEVQRQLFVKAAEKIGGVVECLVHLYRLNSSYYFTKDSLFSYLYDYLVEFTDEYNPTVFVRGFIAKMIEILNLGLEETDRLGVMMQLIVLTGLFDRPNEEPRTLDNFLEKESKDTLFKVLFLETKTKKKYFNGLQIPDHIKGDERNILAKLNKAYPDLVHKICLASVNEQLALFNNGANIVQQLILARILYPDKLVHLIENLITEKLGKDALRKDIDLNRIIERFITPNRPLLLTLKGINDPTDNIEYIFKNKGTKVVILTLGNITEQEAQISIEQNSRNDCTLIIRNMHLLPDLNKTIVAILSHESPHPSFRLIITTEPIKTYSNVFFDMCYRVVIENRPNLLNTFHNCEKLLFNQDHKNRLMTNYSFIHALLQERLNYIPTGFVKNYNFNANDVYTARKMLDHFSSNKSVNLLKDVICNFIYVSKVDNPRDEDIVEIYFDKYFNEEFNAMLYTSNSDFNNIDPQNFGLDHSASYLKNIAIRDNLFERLKLLNTENIEQHSISTDKSIEELNGFIESYNELKQTFNYSKNLNAFSNENFNFLVTGEYEAVKRLTTQLDEMENQVRSHLKSQIRITEINGYEYLLRGDIPDYILNIWGYQRKFRDYFDSLKSLKSNFDVNTKNMGVNERTYHLNGFIDASKFFEIQNLIIMKETSATSLSLYFTKAANESNSINLNSFYIQGGCIRDYLIACNTSGSDTEPYKFIKSLNVTLVDTKVIRKRKDTIDIPLYYDIKREKLITYIKFDLDENVKKQDFVLASTCLFIYK